MKHDLANDAGQGLGSVDNTSGDTTACRDSSDRETQLSEARVGSIRTDGHAYDVRLGTRE